MGMIHITMNRLDDARVLHERALFIARRVGSRRLEGVSLDRLGVVAIERGLLLEALTLFGQGREVLSAGGYRRGSGICLATSHWLNITSVDR